MADDVTEPIDGIERRLVSLLVAYPGLIRSMPDALVGGSFNDVRLGIVVEAIITLDRARKPVNVDTVSHLLGPNLTRAGGVDAVRWLFVDGYGRTSDDAEHYATEIVNEATRRSLRAAGAEVTQAATHDNVEAGIAAAEVAVRRVADATTPSSTQHIDVHLGDLLDRIERGDEPAGTPTGYADVDAKLGGLHPSRLIVVGARPGMGKTAFVVGITAHVALTEGKPVLFASLEMTPREMTDRLIAHQAKLDLPKVAAYDLAVDERTAWTNAFDRLAGAPIWIDDDPHLTAASLAARARRVKERVGELGLVVVDYLQLMAGSGSTEGRQWEITEISNSLKRLARDLEVPVVACAQLNRLVEGRTNKRPLLADLRESGSVEQDADAVLFLYRDEYYNPDSPDRGVAEVNVAKHRHGPTGTVKLVWLGYCARFVDGTPARDRY